MTPDFAPEVARYPKSSPKPQIAHNSVCEPIVSPDTYDCFVAGCHKVEVYERVSCGYQGISKKECLKDCRCCFDKDAYNSKTQCFFRGKILFSAVSTCSL